MAHQPARRQFRVATGALGVAARGELPRGGGVGTAALDRPGTAGAGTLTRVARPDGAGHSPLGPVAVCEDADVVAVSDFESARTVERLPPGTATVYRPIGAGGMAQYTGDRLIRTQP